MDASEIYLRRNQGERSIDATKKWIFVFSQQQMVQLNCQEETTNSENPLLRQEQPVGCEDLSGELEGEPEGFQPTETKDDAEARKDFWSIQGDFICRHHSEPRVQLCVPNEEAFPMKYIDVTRSTYANLDVLQEKRKDDYWNVHADRSLSGSWTGFTKLTLLSEKPPTGYMWSGEILTTNEATTDLKMWLAVWTQIGKAAQRR